MKRLIAVAALALSALVFGAAPAEATYGTRAIGVDISPNAERLMMMNAYAYGYAVGAYYTCAELGYGSNGMLFGDCFGMLNGNHAYSWPIIEWWAYFGHTVEFDWSIPYNQYTGYVVF